MKRITSLLANAVLPVCATLLLTTLPASSETLELPGSAPRPEVHSAPAGNVPVRIGDTPVPEARPDVPGGEEGKGDPEAIPVPTENPRADDETKTGPDTESVTPPAAPVPEPSPEVTPDETRKAKETVPDPRSTIEPMIMMPAEEIACRQRLRGAEVSFEEAARQTRDGGCSLPYPLAVGSLGKSVKLSPPAVMNCAMAEAMTQFTQKVIQPAAKAGYGQPVTALDQASAFVCRPRHGRATLSEHAFGNALDIARFTLEGGTAIDVKPDPDEKAARFLGAVRKAACGPFKTVLGPGSDADHAYHLHFDLQPRRNGGTFCQ